MARKSLVLKPTLSREEFMTFTAGEEINCADLKRKHHLTSDEHLSGRNLLDMARRGMKDFRKAMAFAKDKWDVKTHQIGGQLFRLFHAKQFERQGNQ
jgi:hypothetical protein